MTRILISGASGLIGCALASSLESGGCQVTPLVRRQAATNEIQWDPSREVAPQTVSGFDAVIHLSGESVAGRWTAAKKARIRDSRVVSTQNLARALAQASRRPEVFICASAVGYYGNRGDEVLTEESPSGNGFLSSVAREWEAATVSAAQAGIRTVNLRIGIVFSNGAGALNQVMAPFRLGLGGRVGSGRQWWSWVHISDLASAVAYLMQNKISGPVNMTAPKPVTNAEFTKALAHAVRRPALLPVPAWAARIALGQFADEAMLSSARVIPKRLCESGFRFAHPELAAALKDLVK